MNRRLRLCMITTFYPPYNFGGDGIFVHRLSNELARRGHQVDVIHCQDAYRLLARRAPIHSYDDHPNVTVHGLQSKFGSISPLATQQLGFPAFKSAQLRQILDKRFDVIHYHNVSLVGGPGVLKYGQGIKLYTMHEYWLVCPTHVLFQFNRAACLKPRCLACSLIHKRPPQWWRYSRLLKTSIEQVDAFLALSRFSKKMHLKMGFDVPIVHLPGFIPEASASPHREHAGQPFFLFVGRLEKLKGAQTLIPVFKQYRRVRLLIAGQGSYEPRLRRLAADSENIQFLGHVSGQKLQALYRQAVAVILPSLCFEVFPLVPLEAFQAKTPVIARNLGATPELVAGSGGGFVYDTAEQLLTIMDQLLENPEQRRERGQRGYQAYRRNWTAEAHLKGYLSLIAELARKKGVGDWS